MFQEKLSAAEIFGSFMIIHQSTSFPAGQNKMKETPISANPHPYKMFLPKQKRKETMLKQIVQSDRPFAISQ